MNKYRYSASQENRQRLNGRYRMNNDMSINSPAEELTGIPAHGSYGSLLFDPRWKSKRVEIMSRDNNCCVICSGADELQVHHRQYHFIKEANGFKMPWAYPDHLLITLCRNCHQRGHSKFKVPTLII